MIKGRKVNRKEHDVIIFTDGRYPSRGRLSSCRCIQHCIGPGIASPSITCALQKISRQGHKPRRRSSPWESYLPRHRHLLLDDSSCPVDLLVRAEDRQRGCGGKAAVCTITEMHIGTRRGIPLMMPVVHVIPPVISRTIFLPGAGVIVGGGACDVMGQVPMHVQHRPCNNWRRR